MSATTISAAGPASPDELQVRALYQRLLDVWNKRSAVDFAAQFQDDGNCIGFDGSQLDGRQAIQSELERIFAEHPTGRYVGSVREVRFLAVEVALLRAVAGMVPAGKTDLDPKLNAVQSLVAANRDGEWRITLFQNTPAQFHGRPELVKQLNEELRQLL
jgi:uncharacterized protein (TIGR02246 family)